jgi:hypothetical protein
MLFAVRKQVKNADLQFCSLRSCSWKMSSPRRGVKSGTSRLGRAVFILENETLNVQNERGPGSALFLQPLAPVESQHL